MFVSRRYVDLFEVVRVCDVIFIYLHFLLYSCAMML